MSPLGICIVNAIGPPAAGSRSERSAFLARELARRGHRVTLVSAELPPGYPSRDRYLEQLLEGEAIERVAVDAGLVPRLRYPGAGNPGLRWAARALAELVWPDYWARFALRAIDILARRRADFDVLLSSGQPFSDHLVGYELRRTLGLPWIADYGDPWSVTLSDRGWEPNGNRETERRLLELSSGVVVTTAETREMFVRELRLPRESVSVIPAGVEPAGLPAPPPGPDLSLLHAGAVYGPRASIAPLLAAVQRHRCAGHALHLTWYGEMRRAEDRERVARVADRVAGRVPHETVREAEAGANVIVVPGNHGGLQLPAKLWRAVGTGRFILGIAADRHDALHSLTDFDRLLVAANDEESLARSLVDLTERTRHMGCEPTGNDVASHSWAERARALEARMVSAMAEEARSDGTALPAARLIRGETWRGTRLVFRIERKVKNARIDGGTAA